MKAIITAVAIMAFACLMTTVPVAVASRLPKPTDFTVKPMDNANSDYVVYYVNQTDGSQLKCVINYGPGSAFKICRDPPAPGLTPPGRRLSTELSKKVNPPIKASQLKRCFKDVSTGTKCYSQFLSSFMAGEVNHIDDHCCQLVLKLDDKCSDVVFGTFHNPFFTALVQYSCYLDR